MDCLNCRISWRRWVLGTFFALALIFSTAPQQVQAQQTNQSVTLSQICTTINASWPDIEAIYLNILAMINQALQSLLQIGVGINIGNINACLPNLNIQLPNLNLANCFSFSANFNCNLNIQLPNLQNCLNSALSALQSFLNQFNIQLNINQILACLSGLINVNVTIPDVLNIISGLLNSILGLLNSLSASIHWYSDVFHFFLNFCQGYNSNGGFVACGGGSTNNGGGSGGGGSAGNNNATNPMNYSYNSTVSGGGGILTSELIPVGGSGGSSGGFQMPAISVKADIKKLSTTPQAPLLTINLTCGLNKCSRTINAKNYTKLKPYIGKQILVLISVYPQGTNQNSSLPIASLVHKPKL